MNLKIPSVKLQKVNELLCQINPGSTVSPSYLSLQSNLSFEAVIKILTAMSHRHVINNQFIIKCRNEDYDMIHKFEFDDNEKMLQFIKENKKYCLECDSELNTTDIDVFFKIKDLIKGEAHE